MKPGRGAAALLMALGLAGCSAAAPPLANTAANPTPITLIGTTIGGLQAELGRPALQRVDGSAQVWLYHSTVCRLNLILYPGPNGAPQVSAATPMPPGVAESTCVASLEQNRAS
jgi:hypothetical protein